VLAEGGARPEHVVRLTWYVLDMDEYLAARHALGAAYREVMGEHFPAMALVGVAGLVEPDAVVEIAVEDPGVVRNVDTPEDYRNALASLTLDS